MGIEPMSNHVPVEEHYLDKTEWISQEDSFEKEVTPWSTGFLI